MPPARALERPSEAGFTLLEVMLVLFISGLMIALVGPRLGARLDVFEQRQQRQAIEDGLRQLPRRARQLGQSLELPKDLAGKEMRDGQPVLPLPPNWQIQIVPPLIISSSGACSGADVRIFSENSENVWGYRVAELSCELSPN